MFDRIKQQVIFGGPRLVSVQLMSARWLLGDITARELNLVALSSIRPPFSALEHRRRSPPLSGVAQWLQAREIGHVRLSKCAVKAFNPRCIPYSAERYSYR